jgi:hypothetical protein
LFSSGIDVVDDNAHNTTATTLVPVQLNARAKTRNKKTRRTLENFQKSKTNDAFELDENQWVTSVKVKSKDKVSAVQLTGCTAVFFWDVNNIPSAWHIFCGNEATDGKSAAEAEEDMGLHPVSVTIVAEKQGNYNELEKAIKAVLPNLENAFEPIIYDMKDLNGDQAFRYDAIAGTKEVTQTKEKRIKKQPQRF